MRVTLQTRLFKPLDRLPSERDLAEQFGVGRPTVREAIRTLELMGLVKVHAGQKGTIIQNPELAAYMESVVEQMSWLVQIEQTKIRQLLEVRDSLELWIALNAATNATQAQLDRMKEILAEMKLTTEDEDLDEYIEKGIDFHGTMAEAIQNLYEANLKVYEAILTKDPEAVQSVMNNHIETERQLLEQIKD